MSYSAGGGRLGPSRGLGRQNIRPFNYKSAHTLQQYQSAHPPLPIPYDLLRDRERLTNTLCLLNLTGQHRRFGLFYERTPPNENAANPLNHKLLKTWSLDAGNVITHHVSNPVLVSVWVNDQTSRLTSGKIWEFTDAFDTIEGVDIINRAPARSSGKRYEVEVEKNDKKNPTVIYIKNTVSNSTMYVSIQTPDEPMDKATLNRKLAENAEINFIELETLTLRQGEDAYFRHIERYLIVDLERYVGGKLTQQDSFVPDVVRGEYVIALKKNSYDTTFTVVQSTATHMIPEQNAITGSYL